MQDRAEERTAAGKKAAEEGGWGHLPDLSADWARMPRETAMKAYSCPTCGAELIWRNASTAATILPLLRQPQRWCRGSSAGTLRPDFVLPFRLSREDAVREL